MKGLVIAIATALTAILVAPAAPAREGAGAQPTSGPAPAQAPAAAPGVQTAAKDPQDPDKIICKSVQVTGSLFSSKRVCRTRAAWEEMARAGREATETLQTSDSGTNIPH
jgi:hypothetical protein